MTGVQTAELLQTPCSTVAGILRPIGSGKRSRVDPPNRSTSWLLAQGVEGNSPLSLAILLRLRSIHRSLPVLVPERNPEDEEGPDTIAGRGVESSEGVRRGGS